MVIMVHIDGSLEDLEERIGTSGLNIVDVLDVPNVRWFLV